MPWWEESVFRLGKGLEHERSLAFLQEKQAPITAYVDCDYAGTGRSTSEVERCVSYTRSIIGNAQMSDHRVPQRKLEI
jgi:hypothetical protein